MLIPLVHGAADPLRRRRRAGVVDGHATARCAIVDVADVGEDAILVHDEAPRGPGLAFMLSRLATSVHEPDADRRVPRRRAARVRARRAASSARGAQERTGPGDLETLLHSGATWTVE